jgi:hypothetical protein
VVAASAQASAQQQKPNILFIIGDDIGWMQPSIYHRGLMVGETPNIDRIGNEGAIFMDYLAMQSCTSPDQVSPICWRKAVLCTKPGQPGSGRREAVVVLIAPTNLPARLLAKIVVDDLAEAKR